LHRPKLTRGAQGPKFAGRRMGLGSAVHNSLPAPIIRAHAKDQQ